MKPASSFASHLLLLTLPTALACSSANVGGDPLVGDDDIITENVHAKKIAVCKTKADAAKAAASVTSDDTTATLDYLECIEAANDATVARMMTVLDRRDERVAGVQGQDGDAEAFGDHRNAAAVLCNALLEALPTAPADGGRSMTAYCQLSFESALALQIDAYLDLGTKSLNVPLADQVWDSCTSKTKASDRATCVTSLLSDTASLVSSSASSAGAGAAVTSAAMNFEASVNSVCVALADASPAARTENANRTTETTEVYDRCRAFGTFRGVVALQSLIDE